MHRSHPTVAEYVIQRLAALGIDRVFGLPGDYSFPIDDAIETTPGIQWVLCANELNAAYAADGYARVRGAAVMTTTYGVGELSAINGLMGARAHRLPVFHLVGAPSLRLQRKHLVAHHTLGDGVYGNFVAIAAAAGCVSAVLTPDNAILELERVIAEALRQSAPAYIQIPQDLAKMPVIGTPVSGQPLAAVRRNGSDPRELAAALEEILARLNTARNPVVLPTMLVARYGLTHACLALINRTRLPFAAAPIDKGLFSEAHPQFLGIYNGVNSAPASVKAQVETADLILEIGDHIEVDLNTGLRTNDIDPGRLITLAEDHVRIGDKVFSCVALGDLLQALLPVAPVFASPTVPAEPLPPVPAGRADEALTSASFYPRLQGLLRDGDVLVGETGSCMFHLNKLRLPDGVSYQAQGLWGSIGWATPATLGVALADRQRRVILVTGDGSHQLTANELGVMGQEGIKPVIFVLNNGLFAIEEVLIPEEGPVRSYDRLPRWDYRALPAAMGCKDWFVARVSTLGELEQVLSQIPTLDRAAYIEVILPAAENHRFSLEVIERLYEEKTPD